MKTLLLCLSASGLTFSLLSAQTQLEAKLSAAIKPAPEQFGQVSADDKRIVINKVATLLGQHVTFRDHDVAASIYQTSNGLLHNVEWRNMRISMIVPTQLKSTDKAEGIDKRIQAMLVFDTCRLLDPKTNNWTSWNQKGHPLFPPAINVYWKNGHPMVDGGMHLPQFRPGPLATPASATINPLTPATADNNKPPIKKPEGGGFSSGTGNGGLPPGMQRK